MAGDKNSWLKAKDGVFYEILIKRRTQISLR